VALWCFVRARKRLHSPQAPRNIVCAFSGTSLTICTYLTLRWRHNLDIAVNAHLQDFVALPNSHPVVLWEPAGTAEGAELHEG